MKKMAGKLCAQTNSVCIKFAAAVLIMISACSGLKRELENYNNSITNNSVITIKTDLADAKALFTVRSLEWPHKIARETNAPFQPNRNVITADTLSPLVKLTNSGTVQDALMAMDASGKNATSVLPNLSNVAVSPLGDVFLTFEKPLFHTSTLSKIDITNHDNPSLYNSLSTCQIFIVSKKVSEFELGETADIICVTSDLELDALGLKTNRMQFDEAGNAYFIAHASDNGNGLLIKYETQTGKLVEVINSNTCLSDFLITANGGILYSEAVLSEDGCEEDDGFLKFKKPDGETMEITAGRLDYIFAPIWAGKHFGQIVFYGPDPSSSVNQSADEMCLFRFNPDDPTNNRLTKIANCNMDAHEQINNMTTIIKRKSYCELSHAAIGSDQPAKIIIADHVKDGQDEPEIYLVGNIYIKHAGAWTCNLCVSQPNNGPCIDGSGMVQNYQDQNTCETAGFMWQTTPNCYNNITTGICSTILKHASWQRNAERCEQPYNGWYSVHSALVRIDGGEEYTLTILSDINKESVTDAWNINGKLYYEAYDYETRSTKLIDVDGSRELVKDLEVYELSQDPQDESLLLMSALRPSDDMYIIGTLNPEAEDPASTLDIRANIVGRLGAWVVLGSQDNFNTKDVYK